MCSIPNQTKKGIVIKPIISLELNFLCQIDLVDMQACNKTVS